MYTALLEYLTTPEQDGMRSALFLFNLAVFKDLYRKHVESLNRPFRRSAHFFFIPALIRALPSELMTRLAPPPDSSLLACCR
jgi:hypothetical protein